MTRLPQTTAAPDPAALFSPPTSAAVPSKSSMATLPSTTAGPVPTPLPHRDREEEAPVAKEQDVEEEAKTFKLPKLRLVIEDLGHPGAIRFLAANNPSPVFEKAVKVVLHQLYQEHRTSIPGTRSVTLYLEEMDGVAYTTGSSLDNDHKEIRKHPLTQQTHYLDGPLNLPSLDFSLGYIANIKTAPEGADGDVTGAYEIAGVLTHELVHCFQHNGCGRANGGLIEGIADWVRLRAHLGATHWRPADVPEKWDAGYEKTAFFLEWLETHKVGKGAVRRVNEKLRRDKYVEDTFWTELFGASVESLFKQYVRALKPGT